MTTHGKVDTVRQDLFNRFSIYDMIQACVEGEEAIKSGGELYLPMPNAEIDTTENKARYKAYKTRAVYYNATGRTREGLAGQVFANDPELEYPPRLEMLVTDSNGAGIGLLQLAKMTVNDVLSYGRHGLWVDFPSMERPVTAKELVDGIVRPIIRTYDPRDAINWRTVVRGSQKLLSLVVLRESYDDQDDGFGATTRTQYRELRLDDNGEYYVQLWRDESNIPSEQAPQTNTAMPNGSSSRYVPHGPKVYPTDANGNRLTEIPFTFVGAVNNDETIDPPPMADLARINLGHYRNSADYEEACFICGQPTLFIAGMTASWYKDILKEKIPFGARGGVALNEGAVPHLIQAKANMLPFEAMVHKEKQMVALGAKLIENRSVQRTLGEAEMERTGELSALSVVARNVSRAYTWAMEWCAAFVGEAESSIKMELSTDFAVTRLTANDRVQLLRDWQGGGIAWTEYRDILRKAGVKLKDDDAARKEIEEETLLAIGEPDESGSDSNGAGTRDNGVKMVSPNGQV